MLCIYNKLSLPLQRYTQFKDAVCSLGIKLVVEKEGDALLEYAVKHAYEPIIHLLKSWRAQPVHIQGTTS